MNLTQWFNFDYFIQNIKKSKAVIVFISLLVPIFTALMLLMNNGSNYVVEFYELGLFNTFFMYIVPIVLSITLFNFAFKKKSCDFIGGMPISRRAIFASNTIGGILVILLIQAVTALITLIVSKIAFNAVLFGAMIFDVFVFYTLAYIFVFTVCNLAICFSGNVFATLVSVLLILFLVPFTLEVSKIYNVELTTKSKVVNDNGTITYYKPYNFTAPSMTLEIIDGSFGYDFNKASAVKMAVLSVVYIAIGTYLFGRKKYEFAEESYENLAVHLIIKFLTLTPFIAIFALSRLYEEPFPLVTFIVILAVYYFVFDLITGKKVQLRVTIPAFIVSSLTMFAIFQLTVPHIYGFAKESFNISDVSSVRINSLYLLGAGPYKFDLNITDGSTISKLLLSGYDDEIPFYSSYRYDKQAEMTITLNNGQKHTFKKSIVNSFIEDIGSYGDEKISVSKTDFIPMIEERGLSDAEKDTIRLALEKDLEGITYREYYEKLTNKRMPYYLNFVAYNNHRLISEDYSYAGFTNTANEIAKIVNDQAVTGIKMMSLSDKNWVNYGANWRIDCINDLAKYVIEKNPNIEFSEVDMKMFSNNGVGVTETLPSATPEFKYSDDTLIYPELLSIEGLFYSDVVPGDEIANFILEHNNGFDINKPYFAILSHMPNDMVFLTNDIEEFYKLFAKWHNESVKKFIESGEEPNREALPYLQLLSEE
jgi:ABC-type transport system involved in multi-copper enzyme maturation permease subunit